jgi:acyl carrier protein
MTKAGEHAPEPEAIGNVPPLDAGAFGAPVARAAETARDAVRRRVVGVLRAECPELATHAIALPDALQADLGLDSGAFISVLLALERSLMWSSRIRDVSGLATVEDLVRFVEAYASAAGGAVKRRALPMTRPAIRRGGIVLDAAQRAEVQALLQNPRGGAWLPRGRDHRRREPRERSRRRFMTMVEVLVHLSDRFSSIWTSASSVKLGKRSLGLSFRDFLDDVFHFLAHLDEIRPRCGRRAGGRRPARPAARGMMPGDTAAFLEEWQAWSRRIDDMREAGLYFYMRRVDGAQGPHVRAHGQDLPCSPQQLPRPGERPRLKAAAVRAVEEFGTARAAQLINGYSTAHAAFEDAIRRFRGTEAAVVFTTGYQANVGAISALVGDGDVVICDKLVHASILDGARLSGAHLRLVGHNDLEKLRQILSASGQFRKRLVVVDGVYSMDGDLADLPSIAALTREFGALLMVDEAHATGVMGADGRGTIEHFGLEREVDVVMGT